MTAEREVDLDVQPVLTPSEHNFVGDLDAASLLVTPGRSLVRAPLSAAVSSTAGSAALGVLMTLMDVGASDPALVSCRPDWTATLDLSMHAAGWLTRGPIVVDSRLVRTGKKVIVVVADVYDGRGVHDFDDVQVGIRDAAGSPSDAGPIRVASGVITFARVPRTAARGVDDYDPSNWVGQIRHRLTGPPTPGTLYERMGVRIVDPDRGVLELDRVPYVANSIGTINGGAQAVLIQAAAESVRARLVATDMQIHYLSQVKAGPARTAVTVSRDAADHSVVTVELADAGNENRLLALAAVTLQRPPS